MQILKDYHLYEDLFRLNHDLYFHQHFKAPEVAHSLCSPSDHPEYMEQSRNIVIYFFNLSHTIDKDVYIIMKWLVVAHDIIKNVKYYRVLREMEQALAKMGEAKMRSKYDQYLFEKLVKPYRHYLQKLCTLLDGEASRGNNNEREAIQKNQEEWFLKYNLVKYALYEFCPIFAQVIGFFKENYPFLTKMSIQIGSDIEKFLKDIKAGYRLQEVKYVQKRQLEEFEDSFSKMNEFFPHTWSESIFFTESQICNNKFQYLFQSGSKTDGTVLFA